jgi:hypothetical protein
VRGLLLLNLLTLLFGRCGTPTSAHTPGHAHAHNARTRVPAAVASQPPHAFRRHLFAPPAPPCAAPAPAATWRW